MFCHNDMIYLWLTTIVRRRLNWKWLVLPTLPTSRSVRNLFQTQKTFFTTKVFLLISSLATRSSAGDWGNSRSCPSWPVQPNTAGWGGSRCAFCPGSSHVISCHIVSWPTISYHTYTLQATTFPGGDGLWDEGGGGEGDQLRWIHTESSNKASWPFFPFPPQNSDGMLFTHYLRICRSHLHLKAHQLHQWSVTTDQWPALMKRTFSEWSDCVICKSLNNKNNFDEFCILSYS